MRLSLVPVYRRLGIGYLSNVYGVVVAAGGGVGVNGAASPRGGKVGGKLNI
jgi:hypothetical protein